MESAQTFSCDVCGRKVKWSPAIAGKTGRCKCGATLRAPDSVDALGEDDLLLRLATAPKPLQEEPAYVQPPPVPGLAYARAPDADDTSVERMDLLREIYIPAGVLVLGFGLLLAFLGFEGYFVSRAIRNTVFLAGTLMVVKTVVLGALAWLVARNSGGSLGNPLTFVLKVAGLVVVLDAAILWAWAGMVGVGAIGPDGRFYIVKTFLALLMVTIVVAAVIAQLLYGLRGDEANLFSRFVAWGNLMLNIVFVVGLGIYAQSLGAKRRPPNLANAQVAAARMPAPPAAAPSGSMYIPVVTLVSPLSAQSMAVAPPSAVSVDTNPDHLIARRIMQGAPVVMEGRDWTKTTFILDRQKPIARLIGEMYDAGAKRVYIDEVGDGMHLPASGLPADMYVELPAGAEERAGIYKVGGRFQESDAKVTLTPASVGEVRFLTIRFGE
jgi:hypothetical protein